MSKSPQLPATCKIVYLVEGKPTECGGSFKARTVSEPAKLRDWVAGDSGVQPVLLEYKYCDRCGVMSVNPRTNT